MTRSKIKAPDDLTNSVMRVEGNFKFFEIETLLRNICFDTFEPLRLRILKESEPARVAKAMSEKANTIIANMDNRVKTLESKMRVLESLDRKVEQMDRSIYEEYQKNYNKVDELSLKLERCR